MTTQMDVTGTVDLLDYKDVSSDIREIYENHYKKDPNKKFDRIEHRIKFVDKLFKGEVKGYQVCDTRYHDFPHTTGTALAMSRIFNGMNKFSADPNPYKVSREIFELGVISGILHDTGFIKKTNDYEGTGAKYTLEHVGRSVNFAYDLEFDYSSIIKIDNIIRCTGVGLDINKIPFHSDEEKMAGLVLCTADYLSQMSASDYLDKLTILYEEFKEGGVPSFESAEDLIRKTPNFWRKIVLSKLEKECESVYKFLDYHFGEGRNLYIEAIEKNIMRIEQSSNYSE